jgi:hypothetical protein
VSGAVVGVLGSTAQTIDPRGHEIAAHLSLGGRRPLLRRIERLDVAHDVVVGVEGEPFDVPGRIRDIRLRDIAGPVERIRERLDRDRIGQRLLGHPPIRGRFQFTSR